MSAGNGDNLRLARIALAAIVILFIAAGRSAAGEIKVVVERKKAYHATPEFVFKNVPCPSADVAAKKATFSLVAGEADPNCVGLGKFNDGKLPRDDDDPSRNFFFAAGTPGGRLRIDLHKVIHIGEIDTYSWHADTRGAQVYKVYGSDGAAAAFDPAPQEAVEPEKCGWKRIAAVDTRPAGGRLSGQYGVSISAGRGEIGTYRYLLFDISRTESADLFGNTFYSRIDVIDAATARAPKPPAATCPTAHGPTKYEIVIDCEMPELKPWAERTLRPTLEKWYPIIVAELPGDEYAPPQKFTVTIKQDARVYPNGPEFVAFTTGTHVVCSGPWLKANEEGEAVGAVVHELVHVDQQIRDRRAPRWLVEGVADYVRWFQYEPESKRPRPDPRRAKFTDGYRTTAAFLNYLTEKYDKRIVAKLNAAMREEEYSDALFKKYTAKEPGDLWEEYAATLKPQE